MGWKCPICNSENRDSILRCICGYESDIVTCSKCGKEVVKGGSFCQYCGKQLSFPVNSSQSFPETSLSGKDFTTSIGTNVDIFGDVQSKARSLKANKKIIEASVCKICNNKFSIGEDIKQCENCQNYFHHKCWEEHGGCNQPGCKEETKLCPMCGKEIKKSALKCRYCGEYLDESIRKRYIPKGRVKGASTSLICAIIGMFVFGFILGWVAISKGRKALKKIEEEPGYTGKGMAIAGITIGIFDIVGWIAAIISRISGIE